MYDNRRYLIIPVSEIENIDFTQVCETSPDTLRKSVDGTLTFIKYDISIIEEDYTESFFNNETGEEMTINHMAGIYGRPNFYSNEFREYTYQEMLNILSSPEWTIDKN